MELSAINKNFPERATDNILNSGLNEFSPWQEQVAKRLKQGGDLIALNSDDVERFQALALATIFHSPDSFEGSPRAIIITSSSERALEIKKIFDVYLMRTEITVEMAHDKGNMIEQRNHIFDGADIILGTPKRIFGLYIQSGINFGEVKFFALDDAENMVKQTTDLARLGDSLPKCQRFLFAKELNAKMDKMIDTCLMNPMEVKS